MLRLEPAYDHRCRSIGRAVLVPLEVVRCVARISVVTGNAIPAGQAKWVRLIQWIIPKPCIGLAGFDYERIDAHKLTRARVVVAPNYLAIRGSVV
jgi:hypothetical protein